MERIKSKFKWNTNDEGEVFEKTFKFNYDSLIGNIKNLIAFIISVLVSAVKLASGATPFAFAIFGAMGSVRNTACYSLDINIYNGSDCLWKSCFN